MKQTVAAPNGLQWTVKRLIVPTGMRPLSRTEILDAAAPRRTVVDVSQPSQPHSGRAAVVGRSGPRQFDK
jgi:hypothetical protein